MCKWTGRAKPQSHTATHVPFLTALRDLQLSSPPLRCLVKRKLFKGPKHHPHRFAQLVLALSHQELFTRTVTDLSLKSIKITTRTLRGQGKKKKNLKTSYYKQKKNKSPHTTVHIRPFFEPVEN